MYKWYSSGMFRNLQAVIFVGFVNTQTCSLVNTALVPMTFKLRVPGDSISDSIDGTSDYDSTFSEAGSTIPPKEFEVTCCLVG